MSISILDKIEYLVLLVAAFAAQCKISEAEAYEVKFNKSINDGAAKAEPNYFIVRRGR